LLNAAKQSEYFLRFDYAFFQKNTPGVLLKRHSRCFANSLILFVSLTFGDLPGWALRYASLHNVDGVGQGAVRRVMSEL